MVTATKHHFDVTLYEEMGVSGIKVSNMANLSNHTVFDIHVVLKMNGKIYNKLTDLSMLHIFIQKQYCY